MAKVRPLKNTDFLSFRPFPCVISTEGRNLISLKSLRFLVARAPRNDIMQTFQKSLKEPYGHFQHCAKEDKRDKLSDMSHELVAARSGTAPYSLGASERLQAAPYSPAQKSFPNFQPSHASVSISDRPGKNYKRLDIGTQGRIKTD